ncbi:kazal-type serine protease inhibitor domain-containing protein 1-like [Pieris brassicae]|uniref:kazal-type serine protease inhibitor domain-containing protein 1-like n=1 Tax=Pieris brassicae TaxID=7116 RepID=UPI001E6620BF|nr:kazal-type serine protease inhibitor domain-containing protein 1-like [Pieris brassicae]
MKLLIVCVTILGVAKTALAYALCGCQPTSPVCGSDWKTYSSECDMKCDNRYNPNPPVVIYNGPCEDLFQVKPDPFDPYNPPQPCNPLDIFNPCLYLGARKTK